MKIIIFAFLFLVSTLASAQFEPVKPTAAEKRALLKRLRSDYSGKFIADLRDEAKVRTVTLKSGSVLVELSGDLAKYILYNLNTAPDRMLYLPRNGPASWHNYYVRSSKEITCGLGSYDLKNDPFPVFKCRFTVNAKGQLKAFFERSASEGGDENAVTDFFYRQVSEVESGAGAYNFVKVQTPGISVAMQVTDQGAQSLYGLMGEIAETPDSMGPTETLMKRGAGLWCMKLVKDGRVLKCRISLSSAGVAVLDL